jgi:hypothetical protein
LRALIRKPLREIIVIVAHDIENGLPGEPAMILGKQLVHCCELFVRHGLVPSLSIPDYIGTEFARSNGQGSQLSEPRVDCDGIHRNFY